MIKASTPNDSAVLALSVLPIASTSPDTYQHPYAKPPDAPSTLHNGLLGTSATPDDAC